MEEVIKAYVEATKRNGMSKCEAIRAVVQQFIDVPRGEIRVKGLAYPVAPGQLAKAARTAAEARARTSSG